MVALLHKHFLYIPCPFFNSASIITNCKYAAMSKHNVTIYDGYPENKLRLLILSLQHRSHDGVRVCRVCWFFGKAQKQSADTRTVSTHRVVFIMFKKIENPAAYEMWWRDTKTGAVLWQVPQEWWKLCRKAVYSMYIKWQYAWFVIYCCFFLIAHRNLLSG